MVENEQLNEPADKNERSPYQVRLPIFITDAEIGLGDLVKRVTSAVGIEPCGGCEERARLLNRWLLFSPRQRA